jgi:hypothetical protein
MKTLLLALFFASQTLAVTYWFEPLVEESAKYVAPATIQRAMAQIEKKRLRESADVHGFSDAVVATYFSAIRVDLGDKARITYLVFPSRYGASFFGAHAISYWLLEKKPDGSVKLLFSGSSDRIDVLSTRSHDFCDIGSYYGDEVDLLRFDGDVYRGEEP